MSDPLSLLGRVLVIGLALVVAAPAVAQDAPGPAPAKKPPAKPAPAADAEQDGAVLPRPSLVFLDRNSIRRPDGFEVRYYRVNAVDPKLVMEELKRWKTKEATVDLLGQAVRFQTDTDAKGRAIDKKAVTAQTTLRIEEHFENWPTLERVLAIIDVPDPQVYVEAKIVEITLDDQLRVGIEAANVTTDRPVGDLFFRGFDAVFSNQLSADAVSTLTLGSDDKFVKFDYVMQLGASGAKAEVLSMPGIVASVGEEATIRVGDREPIVKQNVSGTNVTASTEFEDVGLTLRVLPLQIGRDIVRAAVQPEISRVSEFRITSTSSDRDVINPVISTRNAKTVVTIPDGETVVISGLQQTQELSERKGIPLLKDIPVLGYLFGTTTNREQKTELVVFMTFTVMRGGEGRVIIPPSEIERLGEAASDR